MSQTSVEVERELRNKLVVKAFETREITHRLLVSLAQELAMDIHPVEDILRNHCVSRREFDELLQSQSFQQLYREALIAWGGTSAASIRIKAKMESMVELALPNLFKELEKDGLTPSKVELLKQMMRGGGIGERAAGGGSESNGVQIIINMDASGKQPVTIEGQAISRDAEEA